MTFSTQKIPYFSFNSVIRGPLIFEFRGARMPVSEMVPFKTCLTAALHTKY